MDVVLVLLRLIHIVAAFAWFGMGMVQVLVLGPAQQMAGEAGLRFSKVMNKVPASRMFFSVGGGLTVLAGILLYLTGDTGRSFSQTGNIVLGIGAIAGLAAAVHGGAVLSRGARELSALIDQNVTDTGVNPSGITAIREKATYLALHGRISFALMLIALICMGSARYL